MAVSMPQAAMLYARLAAVVYYLFKEGWFQCRKRQCYTRDSTQKPTKVIEYQMSFNAASGNAIRATLEAKGEELILVVSMPQAAMLYARRRFNKNT